jgi:hypothetical protein
MRSTIQIPGRPLYAVLTVGGVVAALVVPSIAAPMFAARQPADPAGPMYVASQSTDRAGLMYVANQPAEPPWPGPTDPQPMQAASGAAAVPEPLFDSEVEGTVRSGSVNLATTGPGAQTFVLSTVNNGDVTIRFPGAPPGARLGPQEVGSLAQLQDGARIVVEGRLAGDAVTFEATRIELVTDPVASVTQGTFLSFANGKLSILENGVQKTYIISGDTKFRPDDKSAANLVGMASGTRLTVVSERDVATGIVIFPR